MWKKPEGEEQQVATQPQPQMSAPKRDPQPNTQQRSEIGRTIFIKGELLGEEDLLIEGRVEGRIELRQNNVTVGKNGRVKADIYGKTISVEGEVQGNLHGEEHLALRQSSQVRGNIVAPRVVLEDGCRFKGSIDMSPEEAPEPQPSKTKAVEGLVSEPALK